MIPQMQMGKFQITTPHRRRKYCSEFLVLQSGGDWKITKSKVKKHIVPYSSCSFFFSASKSSGSNDSPGLPSMVGRPFNICERNVKVT